MFARVVVLFLVFQGDGCNNRKCTQFFSCLCLDVVEVIFVLEMFGRGVSCSNNGCNRIVFWFRSRVLLVSDVWNWVRLALLNTTFWTDGWFLQKFVLSGVGCVGCGDFNILL